MEDMIHELGEALRHNILQGNKSLGDSERWFSRYPSDYKM